MKAPISIVVPIYNVAGYLTKCVDSIIAQTMRSLEIILVDDGSTDGSGEICDRYAKEDSRITVVHKKNEGLVRARKTGVLAAKGEWIGFVDGDDWIEPDMFQCLYDAVLEHDADISLCGRFEDTGDARKELFHSFPQGYYTRENLIGEIFPTMIAGNEFFEWRISPCVWDKLFRKELLLRRIMDVDDSIIMGEDAAIAYPCLLYANSIQIIRKNLYHYRQTQSSMVRRANEDAETERRRFRVLYRSVKDALDDCSETFNLKEQWLTYVLFLMTPRADVLYEGIEELDFLFPFPQVRKGERVAIYGCGLYGQRLYRYLKRTSFCECVAIVDRRYPELAADDLPVVSPEELKRIQSDAVIVPISFERTRTEIINYLKNVLPKSRIYGIDRNAIFSNETLTAFSLNDANMRGKE